MLVADDERWIRKGIVRMIDAEALGIEEIYEADSAAAVMDIFERFRPQIMLSDVIFPAENGCDICDQIAGRWPQTRIVMISAHDSFDFARRSMRYQAVDYLLKPVSRDQLNQVLKRCVEALRGRQGDSLEKGESLEKAAGELSDKEVARSEYAEYVEEKSSERQIRQMMERIRGRLGDRYTLAAMAAECCLSEVYFSALFKKISGRSPMSYVAWARVEKARELMGATDWKLKKIAERVGYTDYQYFVRVFRRISGEAPGEYRRRLGMEEGDE